MTKQGEDSGQDARGQYIGMYFQCCNAYRRIYLNRDRTAFAGHCPKCARPVRVRVGPGGEKSRFWRAE